MVCVCEKWGDGAPSEQMGMWVCHWHFFHKPMEASSSLWHKGYISKLKCDIFKMIPTLSSCCSSEESVWLGPMAQDFLMTSIHTAGCQSEAWCTAGWGLEKRHQIFYTALIVHALVLAHLIFVLTSWCLNTFHHLFVTVMAPMVYLKAGGRLGIGVTCFCTTHRSLLFLKGWIHSFFVVNPSCKETINNRSLHTGNKFQQTYGSFSSLATASRPWRCNTDVIWSNNHYNNQLFTLARSPFIFFIHLAGFFGGILKYSD